MKKSPKNQFTGTPLPAILLTACLVGSPAFAADYFHLGGADVRIDQAAYYSNTNGIATAATVAPGVALGSLPSDNLFFYNSLVAAPLNKTFELGATGKTYNSLTFGSNAGTTQINRDAVGGTTTHLLGIGAGGITVESGAGPVTFGTTNQRVAVGAYADYTVANNSSSDLTFAREFDGRTNDTTRVITVAGSGNGDTIFKDIRSYSGGRNIAMTIDKTSGTGVVRFDGAATYNYTGATTVTNGTLVIGASAILGNTTTTIGVNGTLAGGGTIGGATTIQGIHSPGFSPGTQTFTNGLSYADTSTLNWELTDNTTTGRGTNYDAVDVTGGSFALATGATIDLSFGVSVDFLNAFWVTNQEWLVVDLSGSATAADSNLFGIGTITGGTNYSPSLGTFGIERKNGLTAADAVYLTWTTIPEPTTAFLGGIGMLLLLRRRRV